MLMIYGKYCIITLLFLIFLTAIGCSFDNATDEEIILDMYADVMRAYAREDLKGVMDPIAKDFNSEVKSQTDYEELKSTKADFILNNSNVRIEFRNIRLNISDNDAIAQYNVILETDQMNSTWVQIDTLHKDGGRWKIISWRISGEQH